METPCERAPTFSVTQRINLKNSNVHYNQKIKKILSSLNLLEALISYETKTLEELAMFNFRNMMLSHENRQLEIQLFHFSCTHGQSHHRTSFDSWIVDERT